MTLDDALELFGEKRYYIFFKDGTWRTATDDQWKKEQLWKLPIEASGHVGGEFDVRVLRAILARGGC